MQRSMLPSDKISRTDCCDIAPNTKAIPLAQMLTMVGFTFGNGRRPIKRF